tara:strand:- start:737 stop:1594 length:858 start_codon:yes stop_codon:yes gene_type:complete
MPDIQKYSGVDMADIEKINGQDVPSGGGTASTTPTATLDYGFGRGIITITNHSSYTNPNYQVSISVDGSEIVSDADVDHNLDTGSDSLGDTIIFSDSSNSANQRTVTIKAQEFGDNVQSAALTLNYTPTFTAYRYIRITNTGPNKTNSGTSWFGVNDWQLFTGAGRSGTEYPTTNLTSATSETGINITSGTARSSTYANWKAFDSSTTGTRFWMTGGSDKYLQIEFEPATYSTPPIIKSHKIRVKYGYYILLEGSNDGTNFTELAFVQVDPSATGNNEDGTLDLG